MDLEAQGAAFIARVALWVLGGLAVGGLGLVVFNHFVDKGRVEQALKDQPVVTQAVVDKAASGVSAGVAQEVAKGSSKAAIQKEKRSNVTTKAITEVEQQITVPDAAVDAYLAGLERLRNRDSTDPARQPVHRCGSHLLPWGDCS